MYWNPTEIGPKLGVFERHIPLQDFASWFPLVRASYELDNDELNAFTPEELKAILRRAFIEAHKTVRGLNNAYHNVEHFSNFFEAQINLIDTLQKRAGHQFPEIVVQAFLFAGLMHDCGHCGATFRSQAPQKTKLFLPWMGEDVASEYVSMCAADKLAKELGFSVPARLFISFLIAATTYGGNTEEGKRLKIDHIKVTDFFGVAMRLCDVAPPHSITEGARRDNSVSIVEIPVSGKPETLEQQLSNRVGFLNYIQILMNSMDELAGCELTEWLGWQERVRQELDCLSSDPSSLKHLLTQTIFGGFRDIALMG